MREFGGIDNLAVAVYQSFRMARPGSAVQNAMLNSIMKFMLIQQDRAGPQEDEMDFLTASQLDALFKDVLGVDNKKKKATTAD